MTLVIALLLLLLLLLAPGVPAATRFPGVHDVATGGRQSADRQSDYRIQPRDRLALHVEGQPDLTTKFEVDDDGAVVLPLVGRVVVAGFTEAELTAKLAERVSDYVKNPQVTVIVEHTERIFVFGEVASPGMYTLRENPTLLELLARAGYKGPSEVLVVRADRADRGAGLADPETAAAADPARVVRVNLWNLEKDVERGALSRNVRLNDGDTVFVPLVDPNLIFVSGQVRNPGPYRVPEGTTVRQALTLAGGPTEQAAVGRTRIVRMVEGRLERVTTRLEDAIQPGDTVTVPEMRLFPVVMADVFSSRNRLPLQLRRGDWLVVTPGLALRRIGLDTNALNSSGEVTDDFTASGGPSVDALVDLGRLRVRTGGSLDFVYFRRYSGERGLDRAAGVSVEVEPVAPVTVFGGWGYKNTRERYSTEVDARPRRFEETRDAGVRVRPTQRLSTELAASEWTNELANSSVYEGVDLRETLNERTRAGTATVRFVLTPLSELFVEGRAARHDFKLSPERDADEAALSVGIAFRPSALVSGEVRAGYMRYLVWDPSAADFRGGIGSADAQVRLNERTILGVRAGRGAGNSFRYQSPYAVVDSFGGSLRRLLFSRFDVFLDGSHQIYRHRAFAAAGDLPERETTHQYTAQLGVQVPGGARLAFDVTYGQRLAVLAPEPGRDYNALRMGLNITYGAFQVQGR